MSYYIWKSFINLKNILSGYMDIIDQYFEKVNELLNKIRDDERENMWKAAELMANAIANGKLIHIIGPGGHSDIGAREMFC
jgi:uncharacterized phosphosugar-binding protein